MPENNRYISAVFFAVLALTAVHATASESSAAPKPPVTVETIRISPAAVLPGQHPAITASIGTSVKQAMEVAVVAVVTRPDHVVKSWQWKRVVITPGEKTSLSLSKDYSTMRSGSYKVEFLVYSPDMKRRLSALARTFTVSTHAREPAPPPRERRARELKPASAPERMHLGVGAYGNALNPAGGATLMLWPWRSVGLQGIYTEGTFTSYEGRLLVKLSRSSVFAPYLGAGYLHVSKNETVIGIDTEIKDAAATGVFGAEIRLGKRVRGYVEVSGTSIRLEKDVTNGPQTARVKVTHAPVTIGAALVWSFF